MRCLPVLLYALIALVLILLPFEKGRGYGDEVNFHHKVVEQFSAEWPDLFYRDYLSATTPGYHTLLAAVDRFVTGDLRVLRLTGALFTVGLLVLLARATTWALAMPMACSMYVVYSGVWLLPDNSAWLMVLACLLLALKPFDWRLTIASGVVLASLVFFRQIHLWVAAPIWASAMAFDRFELGPMLRRWPRGLFAAFVTLPAFAIVLAFFLLWDGLTPPTFQGKYHGGNPAAPAFILSMLACLLPFFIPGAIVGAWRDQRRLVLLGVVLGLVISVLPPTSFDKEAGRYTGLWDIVRVLPTVGDRSPLVWALGALGGGILMGAMVSVPVRVRLILGAALLGFGAATGASHELWQRYTEPMVLMLGAILAMHVPGERPARIAPLVLAAGLLGVTALSLVRAHDVKFQDREPLEQSGSSLRASDPI